MNHIFNQIKPKMKPDKWQEAIAALSLIVIIFSFSLKFTKSEWQNFPLIFLIAIGGIPLILQIIFKAFKGDLGADLLALIGLITAVFLGEYLASALVILMLSSGQALENYATKKASFALEALAKRMPLTAHRKIANGVEDIDISLIRIGDLIEIYPHETCPVDGVVVEGNGLMDESYLTGEPYKLSKAPGSHTLSGAINGDTSIIIRADKLAQDSRYANIIKVMENAENNRPHMRRLADQIGAGFAPIAFIFALITWYFTDVTRFLTVLVVATPCPLLIAIPITIISAISIAARRGIIIRNPIVLEKLPICKTAIFDKTGTLTYGEPELINILTFNNFDKNLVLQLAASLEKYSRHPLAGAIYKAAEVSGLKFIDAKDVTEKPGQGLSGHILEKEVLVTHRKKIDKALIKALPTIASGLECLILIDGKIAAIFHFRDVVRSDGHFFVNHLGPTHNFNKIMIVSGDRSSEVDYLASLLAIKEAYSSQSPEQKLEIVKKENAAAPTLFMGDGINDAPALTAATVGLAFGQHSSVTSESADAVILENNLSKVDELIHISEDTRKIALQSAIGGMVLSFGGMIFGALGMINPVEGALLQELVDVAAILNALRLTWKKRVKTDF